MRKERLLQIIRAPHVTEKTAASDKQIVFKVLGDATKPEIKKTVEELFEVKVESVRIVNIKGKRKNFRQRSGKRSDVKKAYIGLAEPMDYEKIMEG